MFIINFRQIRQLLIIYLAANLVLFLPEGRASKHVYSKSAKLLQSRTNADIILIGQLAEKPQLMNIDYLQCYLGPSDETLNASYAQPNRASAPATNTYWRNIDKFHVAYRLLNSMRNPSDQIVEFNSQIPDNTHMRVKDVDKVLNVSGTPSFDEEGKPISEYDSRPDTRVLVYERPGLADISRIRVCYSGSVLPPPSAEDMQQAMKYRRDTALTYQKQGYHDQATSLLQAHLQSNPADAEAHLKLAESYKARCQVNQAIAEYRIALDKSGDDDDLHKRCLQGLQSLRVQLPDQRAEIPSASSAEAPIINNPSPAGKLDVGF